MRQGTTPTYAVTVAGYDLTDKAVFITLRGRMGRLVTMTPPEPEPEPEQTEGE